MATATAEPREGAASAGSTLSIAIEGMTCASCVGRVERVLSGLPQVSRATVNLATERAEIAFRGAPDRAAVAEAIEAAGYAVREA